MLSMKNRSRHRYPLLALFVLLAILASCTPPGTRALLAGKRLIDEGRYEDAIEPLKTAATLLSTNADAWNYLGVAYQGGNQPASAASAYQRAILLNQNLTEAHYNLGCLWLDQGRWDLAKSEFTGYTLSRPNVADGWLKLGAAQLRGAKADPRSGDLAAAEKSYEEALRLNPRSPDALNGLGLAAMQRNRPRDAAQFFANSLKQQTNFPPALLNLAVVEQGYLNRKADALEHYRAFVAAAPEDSSAAAATAAIHSLEQELNPPPPPPRPVAKAAAPPPNTNVEIARAPVNETARPVTVPKPEVTTNNPKPLVAPPTSVPVTQYVRAPVEPEIHAAQDAPPRTQPVPTPPPTTPPVQAAATNQATNRTAAASPPPHRGFFARINPMNIFHHGPKAPAPTATPLPSAGHATNVIVDTSPADTTTPSQQIQSANTPAPEGVARYEYHIIAPAAAGDHVAAQAAFAEAVKAHRANHLSDAIAKYRRATQLDPAYYEAYYNLGLASAAAGDLPGALMAYETALAIRPEFLDARYNFSLALRRAGYPVDAANELEKILADYPNDTRSHLELAILCAQQLDQPARARQHYVKVLQLDPRNPQAANIRDWLASNPG
jgi:tetratricopeptide (TPR) repeat protein